MSLKEICSNCSKNCCIFLKKPRDYKIQDACEHFSEGNCLLYTSDNWKERLEIGRTFLCELFPAVISLPKVETDKIIIEIIANENCPNKKEILNNEIEKNKIKEILEYIFNEIKSKKAVNIPWFQYHLFKKCLEENENKKIELIFPTI
ncbi:MAG: hypothetical protein EAX96_09350 [Candidatus Lokiarchaeota archaeon]|nr:hypothetical protein [Candidatus Lokiarchaeota archaeon]